MSVETEDAPTTKADPHAQALERFEICISAVSDQQARETEDLRFQIPELQWPEDAKNQRLGGKIGNVPLPPRPMLSIPKLDQPIQMELNKERAAHLGVNIDPLSEDATDDTAEMLQSLYRRMEVDCMAHVARSWAFERYVKAGRGAYRILPEYDPTAPKGTKDQRIRIKRLLHQECALLDPFAEEPDGSDADYGFIYQWVPFDRYKRTPEYKKRKRVDGAFEDLELCTYDGGLLDTLAISKPSWVKGTGESRMVLVVEYWAADYDDDGNRSMTWYKLNAIETIDKKDWPGQYVPIIRIIRELIPFDEEVRCVGMIGPNKDGQRFFNYSASSVAETIGQEPRATWLMAEGQEEGHEQEFLMANVRNFPYLRYKPKMLDGQLSPPPERVQADTSKLGMGLQALSMASEFIHAGTGAYEPSLGQETSKAKSGRSIMALQQQHEQGNSHWVDMLAQVAMAHEARVVLDMMCGDPATGRVGIYDRPGRIVRTLDAEDNHDRVMLNQPFIRQQGTLVPVQQDPNGQHILPPNTNPDDVEHYDLASGAQYAVTVTVGKAYKSRLEEGNEGLGQLFQAEPELFKFLGDIWLNFQTWPGHQAAADRMKKMLPPQLQDEDGQADPKMELQQAKAALQQMQQQMQEMAKALETDKVKADAQIQVQHGKDQTALLKAQMDNETKLAVAELGAKVDRLSLFLEERGRLGVQTHEHVQGGLDRQHEAEMAQMAHQQALQQGQAGAVQDAALADQGHGQAMQQADQSHGHALEQGAQSAQATMDAQAQQAALTPPADAGE